jgi:hypothetical protein
LDDLSEIESDPPSIGYRIIPDPGNWFVEKEGCKCRPSEFGGSTVDD